MGAWIILVVVNKVDLLDMLDTMDWWGIVVNVLEWLYRVDARAGGLNVAGWMVMWKLDILAEGHKNVQFKLTAALLLVFRTPATHCTGSHIAAIRIE